MSQLNQKELSCLFKTGAVVWNSATLELRKVSAHNFEYLGYQKTTGRYETFRGDVVKQLLG